MTLPDSAPAPLVVPADRAQEYLAGLGIPDAAIYQAVAVGDLRAGDIDEFHPKGAPGMTRWIGTVGELRRQMVTEQQWQPQDVLNRPTVKRADQKVTLSVVGCDAATGDPSSTSGPRAANRRGTATIDAVKGQLELITVAALAPSGAAPHSIDDPAPLGQWFVLYHRGADEVQLEVSQAADIDRKTGQFTGWRVRVILAPHRPEGTASERRPLDVGGDDVDFTIVPAS